MRSKSLFLVACVAAILSACGSGPSETPVPPPAPTPPPTPSPAPGTLDASFGQGGMVVTSFGPGRSGTARAVAVAPDGRIVLAGYAAEGQYFKFALVRHNSDGSPDATFGTDGKVVIGIGSGASGIWAMALQPDGRIVVAGYAFLPDMSDPVCALARLNPDGTLDGGFGSGGTILLNRLVELEGSISRIRECTSVALQPDGRIVAATARPPVVLRFNADGSLDYSFGYYGSTAVRTTSLATASIGIRPDGRIDLVGTWWMLAHGVAWGELQARLMPDGSSDAGFGQQGVVFTNRLGPNHESSPLAIGNFAYTPDGKTVAALGAVLRFLPSGEPDPAFTVTMPGSPNSPDYYVQSLARQSNGKIVAAATPGFRVSRLLENGGYDTGFGEGGMVETVFPGDDRAAIAIAVQPDGRIIAAGEIRRYVYVGMGGRMLLTDFGMARYWGDPVAR